MKNRWIEAEARRKGCKAVDIARRRTVQRLIENALLEAFRSHEPIPYTEEGWTLWHQAASRVLEKLGPPPVVAVIGELSEVTHHKQTRYMCGDVIMRIEHG